MNRLGPYELNTIVADDCLNVMMQMPDGCVDLAIIDPPFGINYVSGYYKNGNPFGMMASDDIVNVVWLMFLPRILAPGAAVYCFVRWDVLGIWKQLIEFFGLKVKNCIVWDKMRTGMGDLKGAYAPSHGMILFASRGRHILRQGRPPDIMRVQRVGAKRIHPTQKPEELVMDFIKNSSDKGDLIFDPFMGSGTTAIAADRLGCKFFGCDINPEYVEMALKRLQKDRFLRAQLEMNI